MLGNRHYNDVGQKANDWPASRDFRFQAEFSHLAKKNSKWLKYGLNFFLVAFIFLVLFLGGKIMRFLCWLLVW
jgi:hypothetical protein